MAGLGDVKDIKKVNAAEWLKESKKSGVYDIKWSMIDKSKFVPLTVVNMLSIRSVTYPLFLIRTRLQAQTSNSLYRGTHHAIRTIVRHEGYKALYKGFLFNNLQVVPHFFYITTYEQIRQQASRVTNNVYVLAFLGGVGSSIVAQTLGVPIDVLSQHMQLIGQKAANTNISKPSTSNPSSLVQKGSMDRIVVPERISTASNYSIVKYLSREIYKNEGTRGFYRGYMLSTFFVSATASMWWPFYYFFQSKFRLYLPEQLPTLFIQALCGPFASLSSNLITNPLDVMRTRMQLSKQKESAIQVLRILWREERWGIFVKGLTARLSLTMIHSFLIILGYETVKKLSLKDEYR